MKKVYSTPVFECEEFELDASIASNCGTVVSNGPAVGDQPACADYDDPFAMSARSRVYNVTFYDDKSCDCYTTGNITGYWQS